MEYTSVRITSRTHRKIDHVYIHPYYDSTKYVYNIAVLVVDLPIPFDDYTNAAVLPKSPPIPFNGKLNITIPHYLDVLGPQSLKPYMASVLSNEDCARINGNMDFPTNTLMCIDGMFSSHDIHVSLINSI